MAVSREQMMYVEQFALNEADRECMYIVTWRHVPVTIIAVEKE
jgi:hypothetical protein